MEVVLARAEASANDKDTFSRRDGEFHLLIARASSNPLLLNLYRQINQVRIHAQWDAMKEKILTPDVIVAYNRQHRDIYQALNQRDAQLAQALINEHLEKARDDLLRANSPQPVARVEGSYAFSAALKLSYSVRASSLNCGRRWTTSLRS